MHSQTHAASPNLPRQGGPFARTAAPLRAQRIDRVTSPCEEKTGAGVAPARQPPARCTKPAENRGAAEEKAGFAVMPESSSDTVNEQNLNPIGGCNCRPKSSTTTSCTRAACAKKSAALCAKTSRCSPSRAFFAAAVEHCGKILDIAARVILCSPALNASVLKLVTKYDAGRPFDIGRYTTRKVSPPPGSRTKISSKDEIDCTRAICQHTANRLGKSTLSRPTNIIRRFGGKLRENFALSPVQNGRNRRAVVAKNSTTNE